MLSVHCVYHVQAIPLGSGSHQCALASIALAGELRERSSYSIDIDSLTASLLVFIQHIQPRGLVNVRPAFIRSGDNRDIEVCYIGLHPELSVCVLSESGGGAEYRNFVLILQQAKPCHCQKTSGRQFQTDPGSSSE